MEDDVDDRIVPLEGKCEAKVGEKTKQPQVTLTHGANYGALHGLWSKLWGNKGRVKLHWSPFVIQIGSSGLM